MRATIIHAPGDIRVEDRDYPTVQLPTDAVVKVTASCVCGSDLWPYRGVRPTRTAHVRSATSSSAPWRASAPGSPTWPSATW